MSKAAVVPSPPAPRPGHRREVTARLVISPETELYIHHRRVHLWLADRGITGSRSSRNECCTSVHRAGASLTLVRLDDEIKDLLAAPAEVAVPVLC